MSPIVLGDMRQSLTQILLTLGVALAAVAPASAREIKVEAVEPVVLLDGRFPMACGFAASGQIGGRPIRLEVLNRKTVAGSEFVLAAEVGGAALSGLGISAGDVVGAEGFSELRQVAKGRFERVREFSPDDGAMFIQALMVSGGVISVSEPHEADVEARLAGPLPQSVRALYLNCAGDLVRPD